MATCGAKVLFQQGFKQGSETKVKKNAMRQNETRKKSTTFFTTFFTAFSSLFSPPLSPFDGGKGREGGGGLGGRGEVGRQARLESDGGKEGGGGQRREGRSQLLSGGCGGGKGTIVPNLSNPAM